MNPKTEFNHGAYRSMKSSSIHIEFAKARTQGEWWNTTLSKRKTSSDVRQKSSMIRQSGCCYSMSLLYEPNWGRQMNLPRREQMVSSISSRSISHTTGSLHREYPYALRPLHPKKFSSTGNKNLRPCVSSRSQRHRNAVTAISVEDGRDWNRTLFCNWMPVLSGPKEQAVEKQGRLWRLPSSLSLAGRDSPVIFHHWPQASFDNTIFWRRAHLRLPFSAPQPSEYRGMTDLKDECIPPCTVKWGIYILWANDGRSIKHITSWIRSHAIIRSEGETKLTW